MGFFSLLFFWLGILFIYRIVTALFKAKRYTRDFFNQFNSQESSSRSDRQAGWSRTSRPKGKKIDRNLGEYVEFEDIHETTTRQSNTTDNDDNYTDSEDLQQVSDAEWEDIK